MDHRVLAGRFNARFGRRAGVLLIGGAAEPLYRPSRGGRPARIHYAHDHVRSVLHEIAHWCLADVEARRREDYGLIYEPPPRCARAQARFYAAEVPVQALELLLARACGVDFRFSADNPGADDGPDRRAFERRVLARCRVLQETGPGPCATAVLNALNPDWRAALQPAAVLRPTSRVGVPA